jgi:hypothetical protein
VGVKEASNMMKVEAVSVPFMFLVVFSNESEDEE